MQKLNSTGSFKLTHFAVKDTTGTVGKIWKEFQSKLTVKYQKWLSDFDGCIVKLYKTVVCRQLDKQLILKWNRKKIFVLCLKIVCKFETISNNFIMVYFTNED